MIEKLRIYESDFWNKNQIDEITNKINEIIEQQEQQGFSTYMRSNESSLGAKKGVVPVVDNEIIEQQIRDRKDIEDLYDFIKTLDTLQGKVKA